jgi:hypothetical protein
VLQSLMCGFSISSTGYVRRHAKARHREFAFPWSAATGRRFGALGRPFLAWIACRVGFVRDSRSHVEKEIAKESGVEPPHSKAIGFLLECGDWSPPCGSENELQCVDDCLPSADTASSDRE